MNTVPPHAHNSKTRPRGTDDGQRRPGKRPPMASCCYVTLCSVGATGRWLDGGVPCPPMWPGWTLSFPSQSTDSQRYIEAQKIKPQFSSIPLSRTLKWVSSQTVEAGALLRNLNRLDEAFLVPWITSPQETASPMLGPGGPCKVPSLSDIFYSSYFASSNKSVRILERANTV